jgi:hypothetical protein
MNESVSAIFTQSIGASPNKMAIVFAVVLMFFVGLTILKVIKKGLAETQESDRFDYFDYGMTIIRILGVMLVIAIFLGL